MQYRVIVSFFAGLFVSFVCLFPAFGANVATDAKADLVIQDMANAFKRNDKKRLTALLPQAKGHPLEAWAAYWELKARLDEASSQEIRAFFNKYEGSYQEDRLRNDWLLLLGSRRDWSTLESEYPNYRMRDDRELRCYFLTVEFIQKRPPSGRARRRRSASQLDGDARGR